MSDYYATAAQEEIARVVTASAIIKLGTGDEREDGEWKDYQHNGRFRIAWKPNDDIPIFLLAISETGVRPYRVFVQEERVGGNNHYTHGDFGFDWEQIVRLTRQWREKELENRAQAERIRQMTDLMEDLLPVEGVTIREGVNNLPSATFTIHNVPADKAAAVLDGLAQLLKQEAVYAALD